MSRSRILVGGIATLALAAFTTTAFAQPWSDGPRHLTPGSILIFPLFDSNQGNTIINITNTNTDSSDCENGRRDGKTGDVTVHYTYIDGVTWEEFDLFEVLTPGDTLSVLARGHNHEQQKGWLWVEATDIEEDTRAIDFDYLIGSALVVKTDVDFEWEYAPYTFRALVEEQGDQSKGLTSCDFYFVDGPYDQSDTDSTQVNFDGSEYDYFPETLYIAQFFGEGESEEFEGRVFANKLYLLSTAPFGTDLSILIWNNNEERCSRTFSFDCWTEVALSDISKCALQENLNEDSDNSELLSIPYGWVSFNSNDGILGCFVQTITPSTDGSKDVLAAGDALHFAGFRSTYLPRFQF